MNNVVVKKNLRYVGYTPSQIDGLVLESINKKETAKFIIPSINKSRLKSCSNYPNSWLENDRDVECFALNVIIGGNDAPSLIKTKHVMQSFLDFMNTNTWLRHVGDLGEDLLFMKVVKSDAVQGAFTITFITRFTRTILEKMKDAVIEFFKDYTSLSYGTGAIGEREIDLVEEIDFKPILDDYYESRCFATSGNKVEWFKIVTEDKEPVLWVLSRNIDESGIYIRDMIRKDTFFDVDGQRIISIEDRYPRLNLVNFQDIEDYKLSMANFSNIIFGAKMKEADKKGVDYILIGDFLSDLSIVRKYHDFIYKREGFDKFVKI